MEKCHIRLSMTVFDCRNLTIIERQAVNSVTNLAYLRQCFPKKMCDSCRKLCLF